MSRVERLSRPDSWRREFIRANGARCHYCNRTGHLDMGPDERAWWIDHMKPIARGGPDTEDNLVLACKRCNLAKGVQPYEQFRAFARGAFWIPDDWRASEASLDELMILYTASEARVLNAEDLTWRLDQERRCIVVTGAESYAGNFAEPLITIAERIRDEPGMSSRSRSYWDSLTLLEFVAKARELIPSLVAEIRMLRGEVAQEAE